MQGRLRPHDALRSTLGEIILDQVGKFMVQMFGLGLIYANHKRRQLEADLPILLVQPNHAASHHPEQQPADLPGRLPGSLGDGIDRFELPGQMACQGGLLGWKDFLQDADLHPRFGTGKTIRKMVKSVCKLSKTIVDLFFFFL